MRGKKVGWLRTQGSLGSASQGAVIEHIDALSEWEGGGLAGRGEGWGELGWRHGGLRAFCFWRPTARVGSDGTQWRQRSPLDWRARDGRQHVAAEQWAICAGTDCIGDQLCIVRP